MPKTYGYIRVSSKDQNEDRQRLALLEFGVPRRNLCIEKRSGKDFERPQYKRLLRILRPGDLLVVMSIDRLGRNYEEIQNQWRRITKELKVNIVVLDMPLLDTRRREGIAAAKRRGVRFGRPPKPVPEAFEQLRADWAANKTSSRAAACKLGIAQDTFLRWVKEK